MDVQNILHLHKLWLRHSPGGKRADLSGAKITPAYTLKTNNY